MVTKEKWVAIMKAAGFSEDDMRRWHAEFEKGAPDEHQEFLEFLHIPPDELSRIRTPTLVVAAQDDLVTPAYFSEELARRIPGAEAKFFAQGGHYFTQVVPRAFHQAVLPFLAAHTREETLRAS